MKELCVEAPNLTPHYVEWDEKARAEFTKDAIELLEAGETVWLNDVAFSLEEEES